MADAPNLDIDVAHDLFSAQCFNAVWDLLDKPTRTPEENQRMEEMAHASLWHWMERDDRTDTNLSVGYWQVSRVYSALGLPDDARRYGELCLEVSAREGVGPFYLGYAHEALARADRLAGLHESADRHVAQARALAAAVADEEARALLLGDLDGLTRQEVQP